MTGLLKLTQPTTFQPSQGLLEALRRTAERLPRRRGAQASVPFRGKRWTIRVKEPSMKEPIGNAVASGPKLSVTCGKEAIDFLLVVKTVERVKQAN